MRPTGPGKTEIRTRPESLMLFNFDIDGDALKDAHKAFLRAEAVPALKKGAAVTVIGLTDRSGSDAHNLGLSERRVSRTVDFLRGEVPGGFAVKPDSRGFGEEAARREGRPNGSKDERFRSVLVFLHKIAEPNPVRRLTLWLNAFIDNDVRNGDGSAMSFKLTTGPHAGETVIPGPFNGKVPRFDDCYLTDQRSFNSVKRDASSRIHAEVMVDFSGSIPALVQILPFGATVDTVRLRVSTGEVLNTGRGTARGRFTRVSGFVENSKRVTFRFNIAGNNPIAKAPRLVPFSPVPIPREPSKDDPPTPFDPDIDMIGTVTVDADLRTLNFRGLIDGFPFFEGYFSADGGASVTIFQEKPKPGENPASGLPGPPRRAVVVDRRIR